MRSASSPSILVGISLALALAGCSAQPGAGGASAQPSTPPTASASPSTTAGEATGSASVPEGITVTIDQQRLDIPLDMMSIQVHNDSGEKLEIVGATYSDPRFAEPLVWAGDTTVPSDIQRDLRVPIPAPACDAVAALDAEPTTSVEVEYRRGETTVTARYTPTDPFGFVARQTASACFAERVAHQADIALAGVDVDGTGPASIADLRISISNHGDRPVTLASVSSTVLFQPASGDTGWEPGADVGPGESVELVLQAIPSRCDAHALAEDKVGTRFDATVTVAAGSGAEPETGVLTLVASDAQRAELYSYFSERCGLG